MPPPIWTVLFVEDDLAVRDAAAEALTREGFGVFTARTVSGACHLLASIPGRCVVVLDLGLQDGDGRRVLDYLIETRASPMRNPVIVASADPNAADLRRFPYVVDVVQKPYLSRELIASVLDHAS